MTGANFLVAETGAVVVCTNEGNADLCANIPGLHIVSVGIEKLIPRSEDLAIFVRMLSRSALGSPITQYTSHFRGPREGGEMHVVLVDNGRSERLGMEEFWTSLKCIRCGACMNTCPVYRRSGGLSYGATYSGPIGLIIDPTFNARKYSNLPFASTLNGSCTNVCPVKINIHEQIYAWRKVLVRQARNAVRQARRHESRGRPFRPSGGLPGGDRANQRRAGKPSALCDLQRPERLGQKPRDAAPARGDLSSMVHQEPRRQAMSSRDAILASIRSNLPKLDRPLPAVPKFDGRSALADLVEAFGKALTRMGGRIVAPDPAGDMRA